MQIGRVYWNNLITLRERVGEGERNIVTEKERLSERES